VAIEVQVGEEIAAEGKDRMSQAADIGNIKEL
jgi:hypothetical protein